MRKMLHLGLTCCFFLVSLVLSAQSPSLTGMWMGKLFQEEVQPFSAYNLRMELKQEGARVTGISYISLINHSELFARMRLEGRWDKGVFSFHEVELLDSKHTDGWGWCLKMGDLRLKQEGQYQRLEGRWEGYMDDFPCKPGTLALEKLNPQAKKEPVKPEVVKTEETVEPTGNFGAVEGRTITHRKEVPMKNETFTVYIWDGDKVDGDIVSMQYNGEWLLRKYPISKTKKALQLEIVPGAENQLVLYAENEGQYPPNTAAITFFDGTQEKNLNLSSDKATCGALKFVLTK
jgi:hypothetical protein